MGIILYALCTKFQCLLYTVATAAVAFSGIRVNIDVLASKVCVPAHKIRAIKARKKG